MLQNGMINALMEEYRRAASELKSVVAEISKEEFCKVQDFHTKDPDCKSIQSILTHVVQSGYTYINYINTISTIPWQEYEKEILTPMEGVLEFEQMLDYTENSFQEIIHLENKEIEKWSFETRWSVTYDFEQLMEHAIVHVLRHRRQIENFLRQEA